MDFLFCKTCGNLLDLPGNNSDFVNCNQCNTPHPCSDFEKHKVLTKSRPNAFSKRTAVVEDEEYSGAIIDEKCSKCGNAQMKFFTMQLRSADEGQTVFYTCTRCNLKLMFVLAKIRDSVSVQPQQFHLPLLTAITQEINRKYSNKIIPNVGLAVLTFDITEIGDPLIHPGSGDYHVKTTFRMTVFRPFIGEIVQGKIRSSSPDGIAITLDFFSDILIPPAFLPENTVFNEQEQLWVWHYEGEEMFLDIGEIVRFRIMNFAYHETFPNPIQLMKSSLSTATAAAATAKAPAPPGQQPSLSATPGNHVDNINGNCPFTITASINEPGLGCIRWWASDVDNHE